MPLLLPLIVHGILSFPIITGVWRIILNTFSRSMRNVLNDYMDFSVLISRRSYTGIWTAVISMAALPALKNVGYNR